MRYDCFRCIETRDSSVMNLNSPVVAAIKHGHRNVVNHILANNLLTDSEIVACLKECFACGSFSDVCVRIALVNMKDIESHAAQLLNLSTVARSTGHKLLKY